ncbi:MAG: hypothetical protein KA604_02565 [Candidatus Saccharimonas sp.]|nr:hypothetical protein [Candidatus Saccharimonas sp.]
MERMEFASPEREDEVDLRLESEVFLDHERIDNSKDVDDQLTRLRDTLSEDSDGIIHLDIPAYRYDFATNPFVGTGPKVTKTYEISRYLDVVFLHRFMYQEILVVGIRSREFVGEAGRAEFVKHIRDTGGVPIIQQHQQPYDFLAMEFLPFMTYHTTAALFRLHHTLEPGVVERPHYPIDVWMIFDAHAYEEIETIDRDFRSPFRLRVGYDRRASLIGVAQIN